MIKTSNSKFEVLGLEKKFQRQKIISKILYFSYELQFDMKCRTLLKLQYAKIRYEFNVCTRSIFHNS